MIEIRKKHNARKERKKERKTNNILTSLKDGAIDSGKHGTKKNTYKIQITII